jgi:hypothetical protein
MHDKRLPMAARLDAAAKVAVYVHARLAQVTQDVTAGIKIVIEGGLPQLPGTNIIMPDSGTASSTNTSSSSTSTSTTKKGNGHDPES